MKRTIKELAQSLGVAPSTVSRALADQPGIAPATVARVQALARELGFRPDARAQALRQGRGDGLVVITPFAAPTITMLRAQALLAAGQAAFGRVQVVTLEPPETLELAVGRALSQNPRAIVVSGIGYGLDSSSRAELRRRGVPLLALDSAIADVDRVQVDRRPGAYQAARLLLLSGCRHLVFFARATWAAPDARLCGIREAFRSLGRPESEIHLLPLAGADSRTGYELMRDLVNRSPLDGAFCYNDDLALGALRALGESRIRVPQEVRLVGFDNLPVAEFVTPALTSVAQPVEEAVAAAVEGCLARLEAPDAPWQTRTFPTRLVVRESAPLEAHALREAVFETPHFA